MISLIVAVAVVGKLAGIDPLSFAFWTISFSSFGRSNNGFILLTPESSPRLRSISLRFTRSVNGNSVRVNFWASSFSRLSGRLFRFFVFVYERLTFFRFVREVLNSDLNSALKFRFSERLRTSRFLSLTKDPVNVFCRLLFERFNQISLLFWQLIPYQEQIGGTVSLYHFPFWFLSDPSLHPLEFFQSAFVDDDSL